MTSSNAPLPAPVVSPPRRVALPWPAYRFVPGLQPHPLRDPAGHGGAGLPADASIELAVARGLDLLAAHYVWEAHEALEHGWRSAGEPTRTTLAGLIKLCATVLRAHLGDARASRHLLRRARDQLAAAPAPEIAGLSDCLDQIEAFCDGGAFPDLSCFASRPAP